MIINKTGKITEDFYYLGHPDVPIFLLDGDNPVIFDAGFTILANRYIDDIQFILGKRQPSFCLLTHVHFDHCGAAAEFKKAFPLMKLAASSEAKDIMVRPNAISLIRDLNQEAAKAAEKFEFSHESFHQFESFNIDIALDDNDIIEYSKDQVIQVVRTPGHTRDCLSYYLPEKKILISSEAAGQIDRTGYIVTDCLANYNQYLNSMIKLNQLEVDILCPGHISVFTYEDANHYMDESLKECQRFYDMVEKYIMEESGDLERVKIRIKAYEYDENPGPKQPEPAYLINLEARILAVQREMGLGEGCDSS